MEADEEATVRALKTYRQSIDSTIANHHGRIFGSAGDSVIAEFVSPVEAVRCAVKIQQELDSGDVDMPNHARMQLRIGINLGDVIVEGKNLLGDGVNIAARLESIADPGGITIARSVYDQVRKQLDLDYVDMGDQQLKNISDVVQVYKVLISDEGSKSNESATLGPLPEYPDKPSIAVLPFVNMSGDPEQEYFSDGISEDLITQLSRFRTLFVIARNSSFSFKGKNIDVKAAGRTLGIQYIVEGSVRRAGNRVRITAQLVEARTGNHIWAERYDRELKDLFDVQDDVTQAIVAVLPGRVQEDVVERASRKPTENMKAYELMLLGKTYRDQLSAEGNAKARECCEKAIALDPRYARAYMYLSDSYIVDLWLGLVEPGKTGLALRLARQAASLDGNDVYIQDHLGFGYLNEGMWDEAEKQFDKTLSKIVNEAESMAWCGYAFLLLGHDDKARDIVVRAMRLDPLHPPTLEWILGQIYYFQGRYEDVIQLLVGEALLNSVAHAFLTGAYAHLGRMEEAQSALAAFILERRKEFNSRHIEIEKENCSTLASAYRIMWRNPANWERKTDSHQVDVRKEYRLCENSKSEKIYGATQQF
jgi:TolB-like protein/Tfp pilus assembly protein PilF